MRLFALIILSVGAVVLQGTFLYRAAPGGVTIDLALLFTLLAAWRIGTIEAVILGLWCGSLLGATMGGLSGPLAVLYALAGWMGSVLVKRPASQPLRRAVFLAGLLGAGMAVSFQGLESLVLGFFGLPVSIDPTTLPWTMLWHGLGLAGFVAASAGKSPLVAALRHRRKAWKSGGASPWVTADSAWLASVG